jgi:hypothetical protein
VRCLTLAQPLPSLISHGVVHVLAMDRPTDHRGPIALHSGAKASRGFFYVRYVDNVLKATPVETRPKELRLPNGTMIPDPGIDSFPRGAIVGTATLIDVVHIVGRCRYDTACVWRSSTGLFYCGNKHLGGTWQSRAISDQLPFGDFIPGRWAWILEDAKPTTERCPGCRGVTSIDLWATGVTSVPERKRFQRCSTCAGKGVCDPMPVKGHAGLWTWEAGR